METTIMGYNNRDYRVGIIGVQQQEDIKVAQD